MKQPSSPGSSFLLSLFVRFLHYSGRMRVTLAVLPFLGLFIVTPCQGGTTGFENTGSLTTARQSHTATLLPDGRVLAAGGADVSDAGSATETSAELFDPASGTWTVTGSLTDGRSSHTATLLPDGRVLVAAGWFGLFGGGT